MNITQLTSWLFINIEPIMFSLAVIVIGVNLELNKKAIVANVIYRWIMLLAVGVVNIFSGILHLQYPDLTFGNTEIAVIDIIFGLIALLTFHARFAYQLAAGMIISCALWGDASIHLYQLYMQNNLTFGNASWLWFNLLVPCIVIGSLIWLKPE